MNPRTPPMTVPGNVRACLSIGAYWLTRRARRDLSSTYHAAVAAIERAPAEDQPYWHAALAQVIARTSS